MTIRHYYAEYIESVSELIHKFKFTSDSISMIDFGVMTINLEDYSFAIELPMTDNLKWGWSKENQEYCASMLSAMIFQKIKSGAILPKSIEYNA